MSSKCKNPKITIALATYNVDSYIQSCLKSIINQTLKNIEIICIDDASTDNTLQILNNYAKKDNRIIVISKSKNEGLAISRNQALEIAKGKYISFVDGDDLMDLDLFNKAYNLAEKENSDLVLWDFVNFWDDSEINISKQKKSTLTNISGKDKESLLKQPSFTWLKLIKTEVAKKIRINFPKGLTKQDIPVHWHLITKINKISILPEKLIYYRQQPNATSYKTDKRLFDVFIVMDITEKLLNDNSIYDIYKNIFLNQKLKLMYVVQDTIVLSYRRDALKEIKKRLKKEEINYLNSNNDLLKQIKFFYLHLQGNFLSKVKYNIWLFLRGIYRFLNKKKNAYRILNRKN